MHGLVRRFFKTHQFIKADSVNAVRIFKNTFSGECFIPHRTQKVLPVSLACVKAVIFFCKGFLPPLSTSKKCPFAALFVKAVPLGITLKPYLFEISLYVLCISSYIFFLVTVVKLKAVVLGRFFIAPCFVQQNFRIRLHFANVVHELFKVRFKALGLSA